MKRIANLLIILGIIGMFGVAFIPEPVSAMTGSGTAGDPYMIYDVGDLQDMDLDLDAYYELANDIDASATIGWNGGAGFEPVGTSTNPFEGYFDGNGYTISGLYINRPSTSYVGLFGKIYAVGANLVFQNVVMEEASITGGGNTGVFAGWIVAYPIAPVGTVTLWYISAAGCAVVGGTNTGGLVGDIMNIVELNYCSYTGTVHGVGYRVGGLVGYASGASLIYRCAAGVIVTQSGWGSRVGGLVGEAQGSIEESYSVGTVSNLGADPNSAYDGIGGLVGLYAPVVQNPAEIENCYSRCTVTGKVGTYGEYAAGLVGVHVGTYSTIINSYSTGSVSGKYTGGFTRGATTTCSNCFWDLQTSGQPTSACGTGKTTVQMKIESTFTNAGWDFDTIWNMEGFVNDGYPYLLWWYQPVWMIDDIYQVVWFQPNTMILGTELPNRTGEEDGEFHWGSNPAGVSVVLSPFYSDYAPTNVTLPQNIITPQDMIGPTGNPGMTRDVGTLPDNPLYPIPKMLSDHWGGTVQLWWIILASLVVLICMVVTYRYLPHQMIVALVGGGLSSFFYAMGIYPFWVPLIFAVMGLAIILGERSPTV